MKHDIITQIRKELKLNSDQKTKDIGQRFFREEVKFYGVKTATVGKIAKKYYTEIKNLPKDDIFFLCEELLKSDYNEEAWIAADWSYNVHTKYEEKDFLIFKSWIEKYINNWAKCDTLCNHTVGSFIEMYPAYIEELKIMSRSENRWVKRASAVSLILPARRGKFLPDIFEIADTLLLDPDDIVQKGYGWMLKEASRKHQTEVFNYIQEHKKIMPRTSLRYAIEKIPEDLKKKAMGKT